MPQSSAPIVGVNLSDLDWRDSFGDEAGVLGDLDGTAYKITLPTNSDVAQVGSATQRSVARVAGFVHRIPAGETEPIEIPPASGSARTDIVALRYDPAHSGPPGPVRLVRIPGTSAGLPTYDDAPPGIEDLPLWAIARQPGQALSQAAATRLFARLTPGVEIPAFAPLPTSAPLGTIARQGAVEYVRTLSGGGVPVWVTTAPSTATPWATAPLFGFGHRPGQTVMFSRDAAGFVHFRGSMQNASTFSAPSGVVFRLPAGFRPETTVTVPISTNTSPFNANVTINTSGDVRVSAFVGTMPAGRVFHMDAIPPYFGS